MAYTQTDLSNVTTAIISLAKGERVSYVGSAGQIVQYAPADIDKLRQLKAEIEAELGSAAGRRRFILTATEKGIW